MTTLTVTKDKQITGRRTKLTPALQDKICEIVGDGNYTITACQAVGIDKSTYFRWLEKGAKEIDNGGGIYGDFLYAIKKAEASSEQALLSVIKKKAIDGKEWLPAMTILERRHPDRWGRKDRSTVHIEETKQIIITTIEVVKDYGKVIEGEVIEDNNTSKGDSQANGH